MRDVEFFKHQVKIVLRNCGLIDPLRIEDYIARDGYGALAKALTEMTPGAGHRRGEAPRACAAAAAPDSRPASSGASPSSARRRRSTSSATPTRATRARSWTAAVLEGDPHCVIEGMAIGAYAIGASRATSTCAPSTRWPSSACSTPSTQAREYGLLGKDILGIGLRLRPRDPHGRRRLRLRRRDRADDLDRGQPRRAAPAPAVPGRQRASGASPTVLNNVETYANVPPIMLQGRRVVRRDRAPRRARAPRSSRSPATSTTPASSRCRWACRSARSSTTSAAACPAARSSRPRRSAVRRAAASRRSTSTSPVDYESLKELGAIMGSGGLIVMDEDSCMVDIARFFLEFVQDESLRQVPAVPRRHQAHARDPRAHLRRARARRATSSGSSSSATRSRRPRSAASARPRPTRCSPPSATSATSTRRTSCDKHCEAGVCATLVRAPCQNACPAGVDVPGFVSPRRREALRRALRLHRERNPLASICAPRLLPPLREQVPARTASTRRSRSVASSAS